MAKEKILLMGPPGSGKTHQILKVVMSLEETNTPVHIIDLEDKLGAILEALDYHPNHMTTYLALDWDEEPSKFSDGGYKQIIDIIGTRVNPGDWIMADRIDLSWPMVQRWFTQQKYNEDLADRLMDKSIQMKKSSMFVPRFDQGSWQVINEQYESRMLRLLYKYRCNVLMTAGIKKADESDPSEFGNLGLIPRGQKELGHQPNSAFLLTQQKQGLDVSWHITTGKDLPNRIRFERDELFDFSIQYLSLYYQP